MTISEETKILNFLINVFKEKGILKRAIIEYKIKISNDEECCPDFFAYIIKEPDFNNYYLLEIKQRKTADDLDRIEKQLKRYRMITAKYLDSSLIPIIENVPIFINYIFYNTPKDIIQQILNNINFDINNAILTFDLTNKSKRRALKFIKEPDSKENHSINSFLIQSSVIDKFWENILIPFTKIDLEGITALGGSASNINIDPSVSSDIILAKLMTFIFQRKIHKLSGTFTIEEFFGFIYKEPIFIIDEDEKKGIIKKLRLFLDFFESFCKEQNILVYRKRGTGRYMIIIKRTDNLFNRIETFRKVLYSKLKEQISRRRLESYF